LNNTNQTIPEAWLLGIPIKHLNRVAFSIFGFNVYWYGIIIGIGVLLGLLMVRYEAKRTKQNPDDYTDFLIYGIVFSIIFARLYYIIFHDGNIKNFFNIRQGGIAIYGSIIGALLTAVVYTRIKEIDLFRFLDTCVFGLLIGQILGRWGNFINREAFGAPIDSPLGLRYLAHQVIGVKESLIDNYIHFDNGLKSLAIQYNNTVYPIIEINGGKYIQAHPTFLYESLWNIALFILLNLYKNNKRFHGEITALYFIGYGIGRFWIEGLRTDQLTIGNTGIPISMLLSGLLVIVLTVILINKRKRYKNRIFFK